MLPHLHTFLSQLEKKTGQAAEFDGQEWHAQCPVHADRGRSLAIHMTYDGRVLVQCRNGCEAARIAGAAGMTLEGLVGKPALERPVRETLFSEISPLGIQLPLAKQEAVTRRLDQCVPATVRWLWPGRIPLGKLTLLVGDPGMGKSLLAFDLAARVSRGRAMPRLDGEAAPVDGASPGSVVLLSAEDDAADTIRPRLEALDADLGRIVVLHAIDQVAFGGSETRRVMFSLERNLAALETVIKSQDDCRLVVIDPIMAYLGRTSAQNHTGIRRMLAPLGQLAKYYGVAVLAVNHLTKKGYGPAIYRSIGSLAFAATARSVLGVFGDPDEPRGRVLVPLKSNLAAAVEGIGYKIPRAEEGSEGETSSPMVHWGTSPISLTAEELLSAAARKVRAGPAVDEAVDWLSTALAAGGQEAAELKRRAKADGIYERTLLRAKARLRVVTSREGFGAGGNWVWRLAE